IGLSRNAWMLAAILILGGLGGAAFHPPAAAMVHRISDARRKAFSMAFHITAGSLGFSLGPLLFAPFVSRNGLASTPLLMLPGLVLVALVLRQVPAVGRLHEHHHDGGVAALRPSAGVLSLLCLLVGLRSLASLSFATFMPVMLTRRGVSVSAAGAAVAIYLFAT